MTGLTPSIRKTHVTKPRRYHRQTEMSPELVYPNQEEVLAVHEDIVDGQPDSETGVRMPAAVHTALSTVSVGHFGRKPETVHEAAATLVRLFVAEHPFVDGNKRTALNIVVVVHEMNGYALPYDGERMRSTLKQFGVDAGDVELDELTEYFRTTARPLDSDRVIDAPERRRLGATVRRANDAERLAAVEELAARDRERNAQTYERLATE